MNLNAIAGRIVAAVNPYEAASLRSSTGFNTADDGKPLPQYAAAVNIAIQVQPLSDDDLRQLDGINLEGIHRAIYANRQLHGIERDAQRGGDLITRADGTLWLVVQVLEAWSSSGWCKVAATQQLRAVS